MHPIHFLREMRKLSNEFSSPSVDSQFENGHIRIQMNSHPKISSPIQMEPMHRGKVSSKKEKKEGK